MPDDRLEMYRTGSMGSRVGPAVTSSRSPARSRTGASRRRSASTISSTSGNRPLPLWPEARAPVSGSSTVTPRRRNVTTLAATAGWSHMPPSIAGTMSTGARAASSRVVRKSSAMPWAALARTFAVAGATTTAWQRSARATCSTASVLCGSKRFESTGRPDRVRNVSAPTNSRACSERQTLTVAPSRVNSRSRYTAL